MRQERIRTQFIPFRVSRNRRGSAFTLVEILVVITLVGLLTSLLVVASMSVLGTSRETATKTTILKVNMLLDARRAAFNQYFDQYVRTTKTNLTPDAKVLERKDLLKKYFPQTWDEAKSLMDDLKVPDTASQPRPQTDATSNTESSEVLYYILMNTKIPGQAEVQTDHFLSSEYVIPGGNGDIFPKGTRRPYFVDSWKISLRFYRWPTRLVRPDGLDYDHDTSLSPPDALVAPTTDQQNVSATLIPSLPRGVTTRGSNGDQKKQLDSDPDDPLGLFSALPSNSGDPTVHQNWLTQVQNFEKTFHTPGTAWSMLIISAGTDNEFGLYLPNTVPPADPTFDITKNGRLCAPISGQSSAVYDNLTNLNILAGVKQ